MSVEEALALIAALREQLEEQRALNRAQSERSAALEKRIAEREALKTPPPPWAKANRPRPDKPEGQRRKRRAAEHHHGRRAMTPTRIVPQAYEQCPTCQYALRGASIARRREVIDLPETSIEVTEHQILKRYCPVCQAGKTPRVSLESEVRGQERRGLRLRSLVGVLRVVHRLPLALIQELREPLYGLRLSEGGIHPMRDRLQRGRAPPRAAIVAARRARPSRPMDETGWREKGQNGSLWVDATDGPTPTRVYA